MSGDLETFGGERPEKLIETAEGLTERGEVVPIFLSLSYSGTKKMGTIWVC